MEVLVERFWPLRWMENFSRAKVKLTGSGRLDTTGYSLKDRFYPEGGGNARGVVY